MSEKDWSKFKEENELPETDEAGNQENTIEDESAAAEPLLSNPEYTALEEQLTLAEQKASENWDKSVRAVAELDNVRRRMEREVTNAHKYGMEKLISALLPVVDSLEQAIQMADKDTDSAMREGLELTMKLFTDMLQKFNVEQIDPVGATFNPQEHEAMSMQDIPGVAPNSVVAVFQKGYRLSDRVIRPARVIVSKNKVAE